MLWTRSSSSVFLAPRFFFWTTAGASSFFSPALGCRRKRLGCEFSWAKVPSGGLHSPAKSTTEGGNCYLCLPMVVGGSTIGVIHLDSLHEPYWGDARTDLARGFVDYAAPILQNVRYFRQLQQRAIQDELTGLYNRRFLEGHLHKQLAMASRYAQPLAVLMLDIDLFKTINDRFGHDAGDLVLRSFSSSLSQTIRASDVVARWGGEEFVVVLPSTIGHAAKALAEKIRKSIEQLSFEEQVPGLSGITVSIGTAAYPDDGTTEEDTAQERGSGALPSQTEPPRVFRRLF